MIHNMRLVKQKIVPRSDFENKAIVKSRMKTNVSLDIDAIFKNRRPAVKYFPSKTE